MPQLNSLVISLGNLLRIYRIGRQNIHWYAAQWRHLMPARDMAMHQLLRPKVISDAVLRSCSCE
jgi:hypothetical protein